MQTIGCPICGNPLARSSGSCARCGETVLSSGTPSRLNEVVLAQEMLFADVPATPAAELQTVLPRLVEVETSTATSTLTASQQVVGEPGETDATIALPHELIRQKHTQRLVATNSATSVEDAPPEPDEIETTLRLPHKKIRQANAEAVEPDEAESTIQLPHKVIKRQHQQATGSALKFPFMRRNVRDFLEEDLLIPFDETLHDEQEDEVMQHHETWQKIVSHKTTHVMPVVSVPAPGKQVPSWLSHLLGQRTTRSFFWLSTLVLVALLLSGAFGIAVSFGRNARKSVANPPPALLASPATVALGGIVTLRGSHFTPGATITMSRDQHIPLVDTGGISTIQANAQGFFSDTFVADPSWLAGAHTLYASDMHTHKQASAPVTVTGQNALQGPPHLLLSSSSLDLGSGDETTNASSLLALSNAGGGQATWQASVSASWLQITPQNGSVTSGKPLSAIVAASRAKLAPGSYEATILFTTNTGQISLSVNMKVTALQPSHEAMMQLSTATLAFEGTARGSTPNVQTITINNPGILPLTWGAGTGNSSWLWEAPSSGVIPPGGQQQITVGADTSGLASGVYKGTLTFANRGSQPAQGSPQNVYVSLTVTPACTLTLSTSSMSFSGEHGAASPASKKLNIGVAQGCAISQSWTATASGGSWLSVSASTGTTPATVKVRVDTAGLAPGTYNGTLTLTTSLSSKMLHVTLTVTPIPCSVSGPSALALQGTAGQANAVSQNVTINASGDCSHGLSWTSSASGGSWLSASPAGTLTSSSSVNIQANLSNLSAGTYNGTVTIAVADSVTGQTVGNIVVSVTLTAQAPQPPANPCALQVPSSTTLSFSASAGSDPTTPGASFTISVTGTCAANVTITPSVDAADSGWLSTTGPVTIASGSAATFTVTVASSTLAAGTYSGTITLAASGGISGSPRTVTVTLSVQ